MTESERTITVDYLARVEGEGSLRVRLRGETVEDVELRIFEPPRFFEAFLRGRSYLEAPDITARICGICPVAYQMSSAHALERALGVTVGGALRDLRRILYCGEWVESHALHIYLLHAPDFLGYSDAVRLAKDHPDAVRRGLALKKAGNHLMQVLGGREIHPINVRVGGFYRAPSRAELDALRPELEQALEIAEETVRFTAGFDFPEIEEDYEFVALRHPDEYPMNEGEVVSSHGVRLPMDRFEEVFEEVQAPYSNALQSVHKGEGSYLVGPLARYALNSDRLPPRARTAARVAGLAPVERNPYRSIVVRSVEVVLALEEALRLIDRYRPPDAPCVPLPATFPATGAAWITEAPRGMLYHRYRLRADGLIEEAKIVAPTSQNQKRIEDDLRHLVGKSLRWDDAALTTACERAVRNHDPCISCATHFLTLEVERIAEGTGESAEANRAAPTLVVGLGQEDRGDDRAGIEVVRVLRRRFRGTEVEFLEGPADVALLLDRWSGRERAIVVDAVRSGRPAGTIQVLEVLGDRLPPTYGGSSTHGLGLAEAVALGRALDRMPRHLTIWGIEVGTIRIGSPPSGPVLRAVEDVTARLARELGGSRRAARET